eukprot:880244-Prymnesium_polylepis.1
MHQGNAPEQRAPQRGRTRRKWPRSVGAACGVRVSARCAGAPRLRDGHLWRAERREPAGGLVEAEGGDAAVELVAREQHLPVLGEAVVLRSRAVVPVGVGRRVRLQREVWRAGRERLADGKPVHGEVVGAQVAQYEPLAARVDRQPVRVAPVLREARAERARLRGRVEVLEHLLWRAAVRRRADDGRAALVGRLVEGQRRHCRREEVGAVHHLLGRVDGDPRREVAQRRGHRLGTDGRAHRRGAGFHLALVALIDLEDHNTVGSGNAHQPRLALVQLQHHRAAAARGIRRLLHDADRAAALADSQHRQHDRAAFGVGERRAVALRGAVDDVRHIGRAACVVRLRRAREPRLSGAACRNFFRDTKRLVQERFRKILVFQEKS